MAGLGAILGIGLGIGAGVNPLYLSLGLAGVGVLFFLFRTFEQVVLALLVLRVAIDCFVSLQLPAVFGVGISTLTLIYITVQLLGKRLVQVDRFWWLLAGWWLVQGTWVALLVFGGLGFDGNFLLESVREWVRLFSWVTGYLLVMQLKGRIAPQRIITILSFSLIAPLTVAALQMVIPNGLPGELSPITTATVSALADGSRIRGTFGHPNGFATYLFLWIGIVWWKVEERKAQWLWLSVLGLLAFFYVGTKALFALMMLAVLIFVLITPRLNALRLIGGICFIAIVLALFGSTEFGQERLGSIANTPLLNPDIDTSRAILLSQGDNNSFNWRIGQWHTLLMAWQHYPLFGYGIGLSTHVSTNKLEPHNDYVRFLVEGGMVGLSIAILFFAAQAMRLVQLLRQAEPNSSQQRFCLVLLAILAAIPVGMITENIWEHTLLFLQWWSFFAIAGWNWEEPPLNQSS
jgi:O-antigen ligase